MRTRDAAPAATIDDVLVMIRPLGAVHGLSRGYQGRRTLCMRPVPEGGAVARFHNVPIAALRAAGWRTCPECARIRALPPGRPACLAPSVESFE